MFESPCLLFFLVPSASREYSVARVDQIIVSEIAAPTSSDLAPPDARTFRNHCQLAQLVLAVGYAPSAQSTTVPVAFGCRPQSPCCHGRSFLQTSHFWRSRRIDTVSIEYLVGNRGVQQLEIVEKNTNRPLRLRAFSRRRWATR